MGGILSVYGRPPSQTRPWQWCCRCGGQVLRARRPGGSVVDGVQLPVCSGAC